MGAELPPNKYVILNKNYGYWSTLGLFGVVMHKEYHRHDLKEEGWGYPIKWHEGDFRVILNAMQGNLVVFSIWAFLIFLVVKVCTE